MHPNHLSHLNSSLLFGRVGILLAVLALPLIVKMVAPNQWYGFRVEKTLSNRQTWYEANLVAGVDLLIAGVAILSTARVSSSARPVPRFATRRRNAPMREYA